MSVHVLENERLRITVADAGAELISAYDKRRQAERIWTGDATVWNRHAPILFPFVGKVNGGRYRIGGREYPMPTQHGFARDREFACVEDSAGTVAHVLTADGETLAGYPWDFRLTVRHRLDDKQPERLCVAWTVENRGAERMYFSIGGHPGFLLPADVRKEDCQILFPGARSLTYIGANSAGFALKAQKTLALSEGRARYQTDIPDTWIFEDGQVKRVGIATPDGAPFVMLDCAQFPMLAVWANPAGPFICLEPWFGRTDDEGFRGTVDEKKDMQRLEPGEAREITYSMTFC
ncbi:MAG: aldose 1-epimerase family protein [Clostridia bacterium]|nr:aldose 1-epimerase family protein [Clostridia bacterium]